MDDIDACDELYKKITKQPKISSLSTWMVERRNNKYSKRINKITMCCGTDIITDSKTGYFFCPECGEQKDHLEIFVGDYVKNYTPYKRLSYFRECITKIQAKQRTVISNDIIEKLKLEHSKLQNTKILDLRLIKSYLKKLKYNYLYPEASYILSILTGNSPSFTQEIEKIFYQSFFKIQSCWSVVKPSKRKTMLSYTYILRKLCELYCPYYTELFQLPVNIDKIIEYDSVWLKICNINEWYFINSLTN